MITTHTMALQGAHAFPVRVECRISRGLPTLLIVGLPTRTVREATERIRAAFAACRLSLPAQRIVINLAPADTPKDGTSLDLALAASILLSSQPHTRLAHSLLLGELGFDGSIRPVRGLIGCLLAASDAGFKTCFIPAAQFHQASDIPGIELVPLQNLTELQRQLTGSKPITRQLSTNPNQVIHKPLVYEVDFSDIAGQETAKRVLEIAAAGGHNVLLGGSPGTGKSLLAKSVASIMPPLASQEILEVTHLHSLVSQQYEQLMATRPIRAPHHSASLATMIGGGRRGLPGEISLAHRGILFLDELPEFRHEVLESLRQPLEDRSISATSNHVRLPADFMLIATANPCPCGYAGTATCRCSQASILRYGQKLSGPLLDRIDMYIEVAQVEPEHLGSQEISMSEAVRHRVQQARRKQLERLPPPRLNASLTNKELKEHACLDNKTRQLLDEATSKLNLSTRGYMRCLKVARTIADLADSEAITVEHISEALQYRKRQNP